MVRTLFITVLASGIGGVLFGLGTAYSVLTINGWQLEFETKAYEVLEQTLLAQSTNPNARAHIEERIHHFGLLRADATEFHNFLITNVGTEDLTLRLDRMSCGCTDLHISHERVPPGGTSTLRLEYSADRAIPGRFSESASILTNDPENREILLVVEGVFTNPVVPVPAAISVSNVPAGMTRTATVRFYGFEEEPLQLSAPIWEDREHFDFHWELSELTEAEKEDIFHLGLARSVVEGTVTIKPGLPGGRFRERFQVSTNFPSQPNVVFTVEGQIVSGNVRISGRGYDDRTGIANLGSTTTGSPLARELQIRFSGVSARSATAEVRSVEPAWLRAELSPPRDAGPFRFFDIRIEVPADAPTGNYGRMEEGLQSHITLETNDETMPILRIPLQFIVVRR